MTAIQWTDQTWNPVTGCTKVSPGCAHCYIERTPPFRMSGRRFVKGEISVRMHDDRLDQPLHWRKPRRVFVNSLSDLFHDDVPYWFIGQVFNRIRRSPQHTFQILTKRPERALAWAREARYAFTGWSLRDGAAVPDGRALPNVWLGVSIENSRHTWRADVLRKIPAAVRFVSAEPLLGSLLARAPLDLTGIDWLIVGGESGPGARRTDPVWIHELVDASRRAGTAPFVKQLGRELARELELADRTHGGDIDEWPTDLQVREFPA